MINNSNKNKVYENKLYNKILFLSRNKLLYTDFCLNDTFQNRISLIFLHVSFLFIKIKDNNENLKYKSFSNVYPVTGTWTMKSRGGLLKRLWKIATTLRYNSVYRGWTNKLGLPNPGILVGVRKTSLNEDFFFVFLVLM